MALSELKTIVASTSNFKVEIGRLNIVTLAAENNIGYRLINKRTNVVEREGFSEGEAIRAMHSSEARLAEVLADPSGANEQAVPDEVADFLLNMHEGGQPN